jgi:Ribbon-helix-helix protein, copG family
MARRTDRGVLIEAWAPREFAGAVDGLAKASGLSRSEFLRRVLTKTALRLGEDDEREGDHS